MNTKKISLWALLNPLVWLEAGVWVLAAVFGPLLRWLGMLTPPRTDGFENIQKSDIEDVAKLAQEQEAAVDAIVREMSPSEVVRAYAKADVAGRAVMDLSALSMEQRDWLFGLSDEDLAKLGMSTTGACARSLERREVLPIYAKPQPEMETAEILRTPTQEDIEEAKRRQIAALFRPIQRELWLAPGVPNLKPQHTPTSLH
ncbi:hypothetical protein GFL38_10565 [Rhizobium leguminosarum bv. viciae]|uniref:hypothetical protein n=1 Tax=Rhizobium ruizarguesonis TaxID=2081791 RepID=UPI00143F8E77|nr:hypothetical protein [Rhizobium ruizarguesonis]NKJ72707.1 hypothetical protein [Rhizobium leguminosarum bv. viciae]